MAPRGKFRQNKKKGNSKQHRKNPKEKHSKYKKNRKTFSLYQNNTKDDTTHRKFEKRKLEHNLEQNSNNKRLKEVIKQVPLILSSEDEEEEEDVLKQLQETFGNKVNKPLAIDSESSSEDENEQKDEVIEREEDKNDDSEDNEEIQTEEPEVDDISIEDPFIKQVHYELNEKLLEALQNPQPIKLQDVWPEFGKMLIELPKYEEEIVAQTTKFSIAESKIYAPCGKAPKRFASNSHLKDLHVKTQIDVNIERANKSIADKGAGIPLTSLQMELFSVVNGYQDLYFPQRTFDNAEEIRFIYSLHAMNHVLKTRTKVVHHNAKLMKMDDVPEEFRDQGLVRPKVLIVVPFKNAAYKIIMMMIDLLIKEDKGNVMNKMRFLAEFTGEELVMPKKNPKPEDYELLFTGNSSDDFKIGLSITKKTLKLYSDFYSSDIIIASPLGLRYIIGAEGESERDYDFLASIELLILDQTEIFTMQNWDHLLHLFNHLHMQPKDSHGTDFSRVRTWSLNGWAKYYRQTLIFSSILLPEINSIFNKRCFNYSGKVRVSNPIAYGSIRQVYTQLPHVFHKFDTSSVAESIDDRFNIFVGKILPQQKESLMKQTLIYVANYFDYVRLRNHFKKEDIGFVQICEYSKDAKIARARDMFYHGDAHFLLYTERYHFFNRKTIKGIRHLVFYQPPNFPNFYYEMCNLMQEANMNKKVGNNSNMTVTVLYSKYDVQQLSAIVGTERSIKMVSSDRNVHMLLTD